jgi:hypothetical protein
MTDIAERADVRMIQAGNRFSFPLETLAQFSAVGKMRRQNFDGNDSVQTGIAGLVDLNRFGLIKFTG